MYDTFSDDYDRFVNWPNRLAGELPFLEATLATVPQPDGNPARLLDAACGTGMHAIAIAALGHKVSAADLFPGMVEKSLRNARDASVNLDVRTAGFGELAPTFGASRFDLLLCLGNSLPHLLSPTGLEAALADFALCLRPGGVVLIQNRNFDLVMAGQERWMDPQTHTEGDLEWVFQRFYDFEPDGLIRFNIVTLNRQGQGDWSADVATTFLRPQLQAELVEYLTRAGYRDIRAYGSTQGEEFDPTASGNLILTAALA
jgi:SAM-dependent methyltransferase